MKYPTSSLAEWLTSPSNQPSQCELMPTLPLDGIDRWESRASDRKPVRRQPRAKRKVATSER